MRALLKKNTLTQEAFKQCFDQYFDSIRNHLYYRSGDEDLATDIAQEVFMKVWEKQFDLDPAKIKSLLYKIAGDIYISQIRKKQVQERYSKSFVLENKTDNPEQQLQYKELKNNYEEALANLPEKQRTVFLMNRMEEMTYKEIAERLELSVKAVEKRMSIALSELKKLLKAK